VKKTIIIMLSILILACDDTISKTLNADSRSKSNSKVTQKMIITKLPYSELKNVRINEQYLDSLTQKMVALTSVEMSKIGWDSIEKSDQSKMDENAIIKVIDTLLIDKKQKIIIVSEESESERSAWFVHYDGSNKIIFRIIVFYQDFLESFLIKTSKINKGAITVETEI
jgi:hypothetical protein